MFGLIRANNSCIWCAEQCLQQLPHQTMTLAAQNLKRRAFWLAAEEKIEFDVRSLNSACCRSTD